MQIIFGISTRRKPLRRQQRPSPSASWVFGVLAAAALLPLLAQPVYASPPMQMAQAGGIKGQDPETAGRGEGTTGWVQAPVPRGHNAPQQESQGKGASRIGSQPDADTPQPPPAQNPSTAIATPLPGPAGVAASQGAK